MGKEAAGIGGGAASGASAGAALGPWGMAVGAVAGGVMGALSDDGGNAEAEAARDADIAAKKQEQDNTKQLLASLQVPSNAYHKIAHDIATKRFQENEKIQGGDVRNVAQIGIDSQSRESLNNELNNMKNIQDEYSGVDTQFNRDYISSVSYPITNT